MKTRIIVFTIVLTTVAVPSWALFGIPLPPLVVFDPLIKVQNDIVNKIEGMVNEEQAHTIRWMVRFARKMWVYRSGARFVMTGQPRWRTRRVDNGHPITESFFAGLNGGDSTGALTDAALEPRLSPDIEDVIQEELRREMGLIDVRDSVLKNGVSQNGFVIGSRREERKVMAEIERDVTAPDGTPTQQLDKIAAASLVNKRQKQQTIELLAAVQEMLIVKNMRRQDDDTEQFQMQLSQYQTKPMVTGAASLATWRRP